LLWFGIGDLVFMVPYRDKEGSLTLLLRLLGTKYK
jgi:hypothetical protein